MLKKIAACAATLALIGAGALNASAADTAPVYMETVATGATLKVLATAGDKIGNYYLPGVPDGLGVVPTSTGIKILMNHEVSPVGVLENLKRAGGAASGGATISGLNFNTTTQSVTSASEFLKSATFFDYSANKFAKKATAPDYAAAADAYGVKNHTNALNRFCSSSYAPAGTLAAKVNGKTVGYTGGVYFTGEEGGNESRGFAVNTTSGELVQLPRLGLAAWETFNNVPTGNATTALLGGEDGTAIDSQLWMYVGKKTNTGTWYQKAGLTNGQNYVLKVADAATDTDFRKVHGKGKVVEATFANVDWRDNGEIQNFQAKTAGTGFTRIEDGVFDKKNPNIFYFNTTESNKDAKATTLNPDDSTVLKRDGGALWKLTFKDVKSPLKGATLEMLLDGSEAPYLNKPDAIEMDSAGNLLIQEDPGNNDQLARVVAYNLETKKIAVIARFKNEYFGPTGAQKMTMDEESSGIVEVTKYLRKSSADTKHYYLLDAQVHTTTVLARPDITDVEVKKELEKLAEGGQLYLLTIDDWSKVVFK
jgi:secreted PhoX family phosphatase